MQRAVRRARVMALVSLAAPVAMLRPVLLHRPVLTPLLAAPRMRRVVQAEMDKGPPSEVPAARRARPLLLPTAAVQHTQMRMRRAAQGGAVTMLGSLAAREASRVAVQRAHQAMGRDQHQ